MKSLVEAVNANYYKVEIEAIDYERKEDFYEYIYVDNLKIALTDIISNAIKQFNKKYKGKSFAITAKLDMNNVNF